MANFDNVLDRPLRAYSTVYGSVCIVYFVLAGMSCGLLTSTIAEAVAGSAYHSLLLGYNDEHGWWGEPAVRGGLKGGVIGLALGGWYLLLSRLRRSFPVALRSSNLMKVIGYAASVSILCWIGGIILLMAWIRFFPESMADSYFPGGTGDRQWARAVCWTVGSMLGRLLGVVGSALVVTLAGLRVR